MDPDARWQLSRFAYFHREGETMVLASARGGERVLLREPAAFAAVALLARPHTVDEIARAIDGIAAEEVRALVGSLAKMGLIAAVDAHGRLGEAIDAALQQWEFHDRLLHNRTQVVRGSFVEDQAVNAGARLPAAAEHDDEPGEVVRLPAPAMPPADPLLTAVLESRRSIRRFGDPPLALSQLGEFLFRIARDPRVAAGMFGLYVTVDRCLDLSAGLYRYLPVEHALERRDGRTTEVASLFRQAMQSAELDRPPQVLLTLTASGDRPVSPARDYACVLRDVGALYQTMYLTATAMGLGACALGIGDDALFARAAHIDNLAEPSVGEFVLGTLPAV